MGAAPTFPDANGMDSESADAGSSLPPGRAACLSAELFQRRAERVPGVLRASGPVCPWTLIGLTDNFLFSDRRESEQRKERGRRRGPEGAVEQVMDPCLSPQHSM